MYDKEILYIIYWTNQQNVYYNDQCSRGFERKKNYRNETKNE